MADALPLTAALSDGGDAVIIGDPYEIEVAGMPLLLCSAVGSAAAPMAEAMTIAERNWSLIVDYWNQEMNVYFVLFFVFVFSDSGRT